MEKSFRSLSLILNIIHDFNLYLFIYFYNGWLYKLDGPFMTLTTFNIMSKHSGRRNAIFINGFYG